MRTFIIEDEVPALTRMKHLVEDHPNLEYVGDASEVEQAILGIEHQRAELLLLDIQLFNGTGFDILDNIQTKPLVIFTTAYHEHALKAFDYMSIDYLLKPIRKSQFLEAVDKIQEFLNRNKTQNLSSLGKWMKEQKTNAIDSFTIKLKEKIILVEYNDISHFVAEDKYVNIHLRNGKKYLLTKTMNQLIEELPSYFLRIHRSSIINRNSVVSLNKLFRGRFMISLSDKHESQIASSRSYRKEIVDAFKL